MRNSEFGMRNFGVRFADDNNKKQDEIISVLFFVIEITSGKARYNNSEFRIMHSELIFTFSPALDFSLPASSACTPRTCLSRNSAEL